MAVRRTGDLTARLHGKSGCYVAIRRIRHPSQVLTGHVPGSGVYPSGTSLRKARRSSRKSVSPRRKPWICAASTSAVPSGSSNRTPVAVQPCHGHPFSALFTPAAAPVVAPCLRYRLPAEYEALYRLLTNQPQVAAPALGATKHLPVSPPLPPLAPPPTLSEGLPSPDSDPAALDALQVPLLAFFLQTKSNSWRNIEWTHGPTRCTRLPGFTGFFAALVGIQAPSSD